MTLRKFSTSFSSASVSRYELCHKFKSQIAKPNWIVVLFNIKRRLDVKCVLRIFTWGSQRVKCKWKHKGFVSMEDLWGKLHTVAKTPGKSRKIPENNSEEIERAWTKINFSDCQNTLITFQTEQKSADWCNEACNHKVCD